MRMCEQVSGLYTKRPVDIMDGEKNHTGFDTDNTEYERTHSCRYDKPFGPAISTDSPMSSPQSFGLILPLGTDFTTNSNVPIRLYGDTGVYARTYSPSFTSKCMPGGKQRQVSGGRENVRLHTPVTSSPLSPRPADKHFFERRVAEVNLFGRRKQAWHFSLRVGPSPSAVAADPSCICCRKVWDCWAFKIKLWTRDSSAK